MSSHPGRRDHGLPWARGWRGAHREIRRRRSRWRPRPKSEGIEPWCVAGDAGVHRDAGTAGFAVRGDGVLRRPAAARHGAAQLRRVGSDARRRGVPQLHAGRVDGRDAQRLSQHRTDHVQRPGLHRSAGDLGQCRADRQHGDHIRHELPGPQDGRADGDRGTPERAGLRRRHLAALRHRPRPRRPRSGEGRQVPDPPARTTTGTCPAATSSRSRRPTRAGWSSVRWGACRA